MCRRLPSLLLSFFLLLLPPSRPVSLALRTAAAVEDRPKGEKEYVSLRRWCVVDVPHAPVVIVSLAQE